MEKKETRQDWNKGNRNTDRILSERDKQYHVPCCPSIVPALLILDVRTGSGEPINQIVVTNTDKLATIRLSSRAGEALTKSREACNPCRFSASLGSHASNVLIPEVARRPGGSAVVSRSKRGENIELASAGNLGSAVTREVEVEAASLACRRGGK